MHCVYRPKFSQQLLLFLPAHRTDHLHVTQLLQCLKYRPKVSRAQLTCQSRAVISVWWDFFPPMADAVCLHNHFPWNAQVTTIQHKQMFVPHQELPSPHMGVLDSGGQFATAPSGGFLGSKRAHAMQQAASRCMFAYQGMLVICDLISASHVSCSITIPRGLRRVPIAAVWATCGATGTTLMQLTVSFLSDLRHEQRRITVNQFSANGTAES